MFAKKRSSMLDNRFSDVLNRSSVNWQQTVVFHWLEHARPDQETHPHRDFEGKAGSPAGRNVNSQVRVFPIFELVARHPEVTPIDLPQQYVRLADDKITLGETHWRRAVAAASALVKHQWSMFGPDFADNVGSRRGKVDAEKGLSRHIREFSLEIITAPGTPE